MVAIREYRESDAPQVGILIAHTYRECNLMELSSEDQHKSLGPFAYARSDEPAHQEEIVRVLRTEMILVAEDAGDVVGVLRGRWDRLQSLFVRGDRQRQGVGRMLVERFEAECRRQQSGVIRLASTLNGAPFCLCMGYTRTTGLRTLTSFGNRGLRYQPMKKTL